MHLPRSFLAVCEEAAVAVDLAVPAPHDPLAALPVHLRYDLCPRAVPLCDNLLFRPRRHLSPHKRTQRARPAPKVRLVLVLGHASRQRATDAYHARGVRAEQQRPRTGRVGVQGADDAVECVGVAVVQVRDGLAAGVWDDGRGVRGVKVREVGVEDGEGGGGGVVEACGAEEFAVFLGFLVSDDLANWNFLEERVCGGAGFHTLCRCRRAPCRLSVLLLLASPWSV